MKKIKRGDPTGTLALECFREAVREAKYNTDNRTEKAAERKRTLNCPLCPPNKHENAKRRGKHGNKKPKYKDKR